MKKIFIYVIAIVIVVLLAYITKIAIGGFIIGGGILNSSIDK